MLFCLCGISNSWRMKYRNGLILAAIALLAVCCGGPVGAANRVIGEPICHDLEFVYARGSGAGSYDSEEWRAFKSAMDYAARDKGYSYDVTDIDYSAVSVAPIKNLFGAYVSAGKSYEFGKSVNDGASAVRKFYQKTMEKCPSTRWVFAGYSQGAMVISKAVKAKIIDGKKVIYVGLFGDPELYLPEGGLWSAACSGRNLSAYRVFVPECKTKTGIFGARNPYQESKLIGKYGLWCNRHDIICGSSRNLLDNGGHLEYAEYGEFAWMGRIIRKRLPTKKSAVNLLRSRPGLTGRLASMPIAKLDENATQRVFAVLPTDEYDVPAMQKLTLDASNSFSLDGDIQEYWWSFDDEPIWSSGNRPIITKTFAKDGLHKLVLRVSDGSNYSQNLEIVIAVGQEKAVAVLSDNNLSQIKLTYAQSQHEAKIDWSDLVFDANARYLGVKLNGLMLGYAELAQDAKVVTLRELDYDTPIDIEVALLDAEYNLSDWVRLMPQTLKSTERGAIAQNMEYNSPSSGVASGLKSHEVAADDAGQSMSGGPSTSLSPYSDVSPYVDTAHDDSALSGKAANRMNAFERWVALAMLVAILLLACLLRFWRWRRRAAEVY